VQPGSARTATTYCRSGARRRRALSARAPRYMEPRRHRLLRGRPAPPAPFPPHGRLLGLGSLQARTLPVRPAGIHRPRCRCRLLNHPRPGKRGRRAARVADRARSETRQPAAKARPRTRASRPHPPEAGKRSSGTLAWFPRPGRRQLDIADSMAWCRPDGQAAMRHEHAASFMLTMAEPVMPCAAAKVHEFGDCDGLPDGALARTPPLGSVNA